MLLNQMRSEQSEPEREAERKEEKRAHEQRMYQLDGKSPNDWQNTRIWFGWGLWQGQPGNTQQTIKKATKKKHSNNITKHFES
jgi:hypothetical protein